MAAAADCYRELGKRRRSRRNRSVGKARSSSRRGRAAEALSSAREAITRSRALSSPVTSSRWPSTCARPSRSWTRAPRRHSPGRVARSSSQSRSTDTEARVSALGTLGLRNALQGLHNGRTRELEEALALARQAELENQIGRAYVFLGMAVVPASGHLLRCGDRSRLRSRFCEETRPRCSGNDVLLAMRGLARAGGGAAGTPTNATASQVLARNVQPLYACRCSSSSGFVRARRGDPDAWTPLERSGRARRAKQDSCGGSSPVAAAKAEAAWLERKPEVIRRGDGDARSIVALERHALMAGRRARILAQPSGHRCRRHSTDAREPVSRASCKATGIALPRTVDRSRVPLPSGACASPREMTSALLRRFRGAERASEHVPPQTSSPVDCGSAASDVARGPRATTARQSAQDSRAREIGRPRASS